MSREDIARIAREHWLEDDDIILFFQKFVSRTPRELRELLDDPVFNVGVVTGLSFARSMHTDRPPQKGDKEIVRKIIETVINTTKDTPHVTLN